MRKDSINIRKARRADAVLLGVTVIWGGTFSIVHGALENISPLLFIGLRFMVGCLVFLPFTIRSLRKVTRKTLYSGIVLGMLLGTGFVLQTIGLDITTASKSAFITGTLVILTPIFQLVIEKRIPQFGNILGVGIVAVGLYFLTMPEGSSLNLGDLLTFGCAIAFALYVVVLDLFTTARFEPALVFIQMSVTALIGLVGAAFLETSRFEPDMSLLWAILYTGVLATTVTTYLQTRYQRETTPTRAAIIFSFEPVFAAMIAVFLFHEHLPFLSYMGGGIIVIGLLVSELWTSAQKPGAASPPT
ncbi:MAG: DMT family transporter [Chlorobi bacterium]|nr:DMT family transporter [Chlorobiota bacterium]